MERRSTPTTGARVGGIVGLILYVVVGFFYLTAGLLVPGAWVVVLWAVWVAGLVAVVQLFRTRPLLVLAAPVLAAGFWLLYIWFGDTFLGWTA